MSEQSDLDIPEGPVSNAVLLAAVKQLISAVKQLDRTLREDYPKRAEIRRSRTNFIMAVVVALVLSYFATVNTVSYCFLQGIPDKGEKPYCQIFPGYEASFDNNRESVAIFLNMQSQIKRNQIEIDRLQKEIELKP